MNDTNLLAIIDSISEGLLLEVANQTVGIWFSRLLRHDLTEDSLPRPADRLPPIAGNQVPSKALLDVAFQLAAFPQEVDQEESLACLLGNPGANEPEPHQFVLAFNIRDLPKGGGRLEDLGVPRIAARALEAAWADGGKFPHALLVGPPGLGKSLLAKIVAKEMGVELKEALAQTLGFGFELQSLLLEAGDRDVVFIDEADELFPPHMSLLYRSLEEQKLFVPKGSSKQNTRSIPLGNFTLLAATNNEYQLVRPLRDRFKLILRFDWYTVEDLTRLLLQQTTALHWGIEGEVLAQIANRSRGTPRVALRLLEACRRTCRSQYESVITMQHFEETCRTEGFDAMGLDRVEQQYLRYLYESEQVVRLGTIASVLGLPPQTVSNVIEDYLVRSDLVARSDLGRQLTRKGREHVKAKLRS